MLLLFSVSRGFPHGEVFVRKTTLPVLQVSCAAWAVAVRPFSSVSYRSVLLMDSTHWRLWNQQTPCWSLLGWKPVALEVSAHLAFRNEKPFSAQSEGAEPPKSSSGGNCCSRTGGLRWDRGVRREALGNTETNMCEPPAHPPWAKGVCKQRGACRGSRKRTGFVGSR